MIQDIFWLATELETAWVETDGVTLNQFVKVSIYVSNIMMDFLLLYHPQALLCSNIKSLLLLIFKFLHL